MPRVISSDVRAAIWAHHQNESPGQNISDKLSLDGMCASKRGVNKIMREMTSERQRAMKPEKNRIKSNTKMWHPLCSYIRSTTLHWSKPRLHFWMTQIKKPEFFCIFRKRTSVTLSGAFNGGGGQGAMPSASNRGGGEKKPILPLPLIICLWKFFWKK